MKSNDANQDEYNVNQYSDEELLTILDLNHNPSDRELEAKIIFNINKYKNIAGESGTQLATFFEDIYAHFFDLGEEEEEGEDEKQESNELMESGTTNVAQSSPEEKRQERANDEGFNNNVSNQPSLIEGQTNR